MSSRFTASVTFPVNVLTQIVDSARRDHQKRARYHASVLSNRRLDYGFLRAGPSRRVLLRGTARPGPPRRASPAAPAMEIYGAFMGLTSSRGIRQRMSSTFVGKLPVFGGGPRSGVTAGVRSRSRPRSSLSLLSAPARSPHQRSEIVTIPAPMSSICRNPPTESPRGAGRESDPPSRRRENCRRRRRARRAATRDDLRRHDHGGRAEQRRRLPASTFSVNARPRE